MRALGLVVVFWAGVGFIVAWSLGLAWAIQSEIWALVALLTAIPVAALSTFMWFAFSEALR